MHPKERRNILLVMCALISVSVIGLCCALGCGSSTGALLGNLLPQEAQRADFDLSFPYNLGAPSPYTQLLKTKSYDPYTRIPGEAPSRVHIYTRRGMLFAVVTLPKEEELTEHLRVRPSVQQVKVRYRRHPDGLWHPLRLIQLSYEFFYKHNPEPVAVIRQMLELDLMMRTVDYIPQSESDIPQKYAGMSATMYQTPWRGELPIKIDAAPVPASMLRIVYAIAAVEDRQQADATARALRDFAEQLVHFEPLPNAPWPRNWGDYAEDARYAARLLTPTLVYLQQHECFHSAALASFINGPLFEIIFGTRFRGETPPLSAS